MNEGTREMATTLAYALLVGVVSGSLRLDRRSSRGTEKPMERLLALETATCPLSGSMRGPLQQSRKDSL